MCIKELTCYAMLLQLRIKLKAPEESASGQVQPAFKSKWNHEVRSKMNPKQSATSLLNLKIEVN